MNWGLASPQTRIVGRPSVRSGCACCDASEPHGRAVQIVLIGALDLDGRDLAYPQRPAARDIDRAVDLRRVALAAAFGDGRTSLVDDHLLAGTDLALEAARRHRLLARHEAVPARFLDIVRDESGEVVGDGALDGLVTEAADAIELGLVEPVEEQVEVGVGLAREADDEGRADGEFRADRAPGLDALQRFFL